MGFEPEVLAQSALWTIAGGARSPAVAATGRTVIGRGSLSEGRAGKQRDQRESSDKRFHDASPFTDDCPWFLQQQSATASACSRGGYRRHGHRMNLYFWVCVLTQ